MGLALLLVAHEPLLLQGPEHGQHGGVGQRVGQGLPHFGHGAGAPGPEHRHHVQLAIAQPQAHPSLLLII